MINVLVVAIIILVVSLIIFLIVIFVTRPDNYVWMCPEGECPTNIITGEKDCSRQGYSVAYEVCSLPYSCTSPVVPNAVQSDGSSVGTGNCEPDTICRCVRDTSCPSYIVSQFTVDSHQKVTQTPVYQVDDPNVQGNLCSVSIDTLFSSGGPCVLTNNWSLSKQYQINDILTCIHSNPCLVGQLSYLANPNTFTIDDVGLYPVACVVGQTGFDSFARPLDPKAVTIWDDPWGGVVQKIIS